MSNDDYLRKQAQEQLQNNPNSQNVTEQQVKNYHDRTVINNEMDRVRADQQRGGNNR